MSGPDSDGLDFRPPAAWIAQSERQLRPMLTRMLPRTSALVVGLVLLAREWAQRTWDVTLALGPLLLLSAAIVLPLLLVLPLVGIAAGRRARFRIDARGLHGATLPGLADTVPWKRVKAVSLVEHQGTLALEATLDLPLSYPKTRRFPFDPGQLSRAALLSALRRFAPPPLVATLPPPPA